MSDTNKAPAGGAASKAKDDGSDTSSAAIVARGERNNRTFGTAADLDDSGPAKITGASGDETSASGAIIEEGALARVDESHPAVDNNPRANTTQDMNRIDMNVPTSIQPEAARVAESLGMNPEADPAVVRTGPQPQPARTAAKS